MRDGAKNHRSRIRSQAIAFGTIKVLSGLTIVILAAIVGFIFWKGLRTSSETRSRVLPWSEAAPDGLVIVVNPGSALKTVEQPVLLGMFTDEYIDWSKIDGEGSELLPLAVDPATPAGAAAAGLVFGHADALGEAASAGTEARELPWGGLVQFLPDAEAAVAKVAATPGAVAIVPREAAAGRRDIATVRLRRLSLAANASALALVGNRQVEDLADAAIAKLALGETTNWDMIGGPDLGVSVLPPPPGSALAAVLAEAGLGAAEGAGRADAGSTETAGSATAAPPAVRPMAAYLEALASTEGAVGYAFAEDLAALRSRDTDAGAGPRLEALVRVGRETGWNLDLAYLVEAPRLSGRVGGISTIILNTFAMLLLTLLIAAPLGVAAAVYLVEYAKQGRLVGLLRLGTETLAGIPSIIFGLFGFLFFVNILHFGFGLLSGCLTLTLMILPTIVRTSEEALKSVPRSLREGSLALGATRLTTIARVVIPAAAPGILTGLILGIGRAVGETAALLFTMGSDYKLASGLFSSARVLSAHIYLLFAEGISFDRAFSTATVLILIVLAFNLAAKRLVSVATRNSSQ